MKKRVLVLLTFVPVAVGYLVNILLALPVVGMAAFYVLPLLTTVFWFCLGRQFACSSWKTVPAICIGNATGIASLLIYLWQFLLESGETRNLDLAVLSQVFSASTPIYLFGGVIRFFYQLLNDVEIATLAAMQVTSVVYMAAVFCAGLFWEKKQAKE